MERIAIIGSPGAGKTTLARELHSVLNIKVYHLDRLFWLRDWKRETGDRRIDILQDVVRGKQWIIEGTYLNSSELHLNAADTIIFLDIPPLLCLQRIIKRHRENQAVSQIVCKIEFGGLNSQSFTQRLIYRRKENHGCFRRDIPAGCTDKLNLLCILKVLFFPLGGRRKLKQKLRNYKSKQIIRFHSANEVKSFLAQQEQDANENTTDLFMLTPI